MHNKSCSVNLRGGRLGEALRGGIISSIVHGSTRHRYYSSDAADANTLPGGRRDSGDVSGPENSNSKIFRMCFQPFQNTCGSVFTHSDRN